MEEKTIVSQPKWKSKYFWLAIASLVSFFLGNYGLYDAIGMTNESFQKFLDLLFVALTALGIWNDSGNAGEW